MKKNKYSAKIVCAYTDDGENIAVDFDYKDSNGVSVQTKKEGADINKLTQGIIGDLVASMAKAKKEAEKPKKPEDMTREELLEALKLMEKEANSARTRNEMLERRLSRQNASQKPKQKQQKYENYIDYNFDVVKEYRKLLDMFDHIG